MPAGPFSVTSTDPSFAQKQLISEEVREKSPSSYNPSSAGQGQEHDQSLCHSRSILVPAKLLHSSPGIVPGTLEHSKGNSQLHIQLFQVIT